MRPDDLVVNAWGARFRGRKLPCAIGKGGISREKREGDGVTPAGIWRITGGMYRADRIAPPPGLGLIPSGHRDIWSDDPADSGYNLPARGRFSPFSHELMRRGDCLYDILLFTDHNQPATPDSAARSLCISGVAHDSRLPDVWLFGNRICSGSSRGGPADPGW